MTKFPFGKAGLLGSLVLAALIVGGSFMFFRGVFTPALGEDTITVYKSPTCGCCTKWEDHLKEAGFDVQSEKRNNMNAIKEEHGIPVALGSCHTGIVAGYRIEGHVPADVVKRLLKEKPAGVVGLAVPGMPIGSPGMEIPGRPAENYEIIAFKRDGSQSVYDRR